MSAIVRHDESIQFMCGNNLIVNARGPYKRRRGGRRGRAKTYVRPFAPRPPVPAPLPDYCLVEWDEHFWYRKVKVFIIILICVALFILSFLS